MYTSWTCTSHDKNKQPPLQRHWKRIKISSVYECTVRRQFWCTFQRLDIYKRMEKIISIYLFIYLFNVIYMNISIYVVSISFRNSKLPCQSRIQCRFSHQSVSPMLFVLSNDPVCQLLSFSLKEIQPYSSFSNCYRTARIIRNIVWNRIWMKYALPSLQSYRAPPNSIHPVDPVLLCMEYCSG